MPVSRPFTLITGSTGFIGGHLCRRLLATDERPVRLLVRNPSRLPADLAAGAEIVIGDLADPASLAAAMRGAEVVFHCAANAATWDTTERYRVANIQGVANLLGAIRATCPALARLVHLSTMDVYGFPTIPCSEDAPLPVTALGYGDSKREGEALVCAATHDWGLRQTILRPGNVIGPGSHFIQNIGTRLRRGPMLVIDGGHVHAGLTPIDLLVDTMIWAAESPIALGRCYNVRDPADVDWAAFMAELRAGVGGRGFLVDLPFVVANALATGAEGLHWLIGSRREPLLHRLLVRMFGRTCGHFPARLLDDRGAPRAGMIADAMRQSIAWFRAKTGLDS
jgi:nucleoside-diphosphate-sugar epimerase